jgi:hypothetical protein
VMAMGENPNSETRIPWIKPEFRNQNAESNQNDE